MKGILFQPWKAEAIRSMGTDRDWQDRRPLKPQPVGVADTEHDWPYQGDYHGPLAAPPRYHAGETVYIKERYDPAVWPDSKPWKSPIFMPAAAARTLLLITGVRVERTRDISEDDCLAEGIEEWLESERYDKVWMEPDPTSYFALYDSINGAGAHLRNWDWVYSFRRVEGVTVGDKPNKEGDR